MVFGKEELEKVNGNLNKLISILEQKGEPTKHPWQLLITKTNNGFLLENPYNDSLDCFDSVVIEEQEETREKDSSFYESKTIKALLWQIREYFGLFHQKHNKYNCIIKIEDEEEKEIDD